MRLFTRMLVLALLLATGPALWADTLITVRNHTDAIPAMGVEESDETSTSWLADNKLRDDREGQSVIVNLDDKKIYVLRHDAKVYHALDLPLDFKKLVPPEQVEQLEAMAAQMEMKVEITPTDETKDVSGYKAKLYKVALSNPMGMAMDLNLWMSTDVDLDASAFKNLYMEMLSAQPMGAEWVKQIMALEGFRVLQETTVTMMGTEFNMVEELVSVEEKEAPAGNYSPPEGYKLEPFDMGAMAGGAF